MAKSNKIPTMEILLNAGTSLFIAGSTTEKGRIQNIAKHIEHVI